MDQISKLISIALAQVGYIEKQTNYNLDDKTANIGNKNYTKYARDLDNISGFYNTKKNGYDWCDIFVDWCFVQAFGKQRALELLNQPEKSCGAGCSFSMNYYKNKGQVYNTPKKGDQIFFKNGISIYHTGLVYKVDNSRVYTIEGNTKPNNEVVANGGMVCKKSYPLNANYIAGYGRPKYEIYSEKVKEENSECTENVILQWQKMMNRTYGCGLIEDNSYGPDSELKANKYYLYYKKPTIQNEHVKFIQKILIQKGYQCGKCGIDGSYGPDTVSAVKEFQKLNNLKIDGYVGAKTTKKLLKNN